MLRLWAWASPSPNPPGAPSFVSLTAKGGNANLSPTNLVSHRKTRGAPCPAFGTWASPRHKSPGAPSFASLTAKGGSVKLSPTNSHPPKPKPNTRTPVLPLWRICSNGSNPVPTKDVLNLSSPQFHKLHIPKLINIFKSANSLLSIP